jgi:hypothetical protein
MMSTSPVPPQSSSKLSPPTLGQVAGDLKWTQPAGAANQGFFGGLHFNGMAVAAFNLAQAGAQLVGTDVYSGESVVTELSQNLAYRPIAIPTFNTAGALAGDYQSFETIFTDPAVYGIQQGKISLGTQVASNLVVVGNDTIVFVSADNRLIGFQFTAPNTATQIFTTNSSGGTVSNVSLQAVDQNTFLYVAPDAATGSGVAYYVSRNGLIGSPIPVQFAVGPVCVAAPYFYILGDDGTDWLFQQYRLDGTSEPWPSYPTLGADSLLLNNVVLYNGALYVGASDGNIYSIDVNSGTSLPTIVTGAYFTSFTPIFIQDGAIFFGEQNGKAYAYDIASDGAKSVYYDTSIDPTWMVGVENGLSVLLNQNGLIGVDLSAALRGFSTDSVLMAEDYVSDGKGGSTPATPAYRTTVQLIDENKNPRVNTSVRIESTDAVTIVAGGESYPLNGSGQAVWLQTDGGGYLDFVSLATDITSPALYLWGAFMVQGEALVVYPDHEALNRLTSYQGSDYQGAKDFSGNTLLPQGVDADQLASTVQNTLGNGVVSTSALNPYSSFPTTTTNLAYQSTKGPTPRAFNAGSCQTFNTSLTFDASGNCTGVAYGHGSGDAKAVEGALFLSFNDFKADIINGAKKIKSMMVTFETDIQHEIQSIEGDIYQFTITAFEDAVSVISGLLKTVFNDLEKAVEWLSKIFDWTAIKTMQANIVGWVDAFNTNIRTSLTNDTQTIIDTLHNFFQDGEKEISGYISDITSDLGVQTFGEQQVNGNDPKQVFGSNGSFAQSRSMHSKMKDNAKSAAITIPTTLPLSLKDAFATIEKLITETIPQQIEPIADELAQALEAFFNSFTHLFTKPSEFFTQSLGSLLTIIGNLGQLALTALDDCLEVVVVLIADLIGTLFNVITGNFQIPVLSELFQLIFGRPLTLIDLVAWVVAIPAVLLSDLTGANSGKLGSQNADQLVAWGASSIFGGLWDALDDGLNVDPDDAIAWIDLATGVLTYGLSVPTSFVFNGDGPSIAYYMMGSFPLLMSFSNAINAAVQPAPESPEGLAEIQAWNTTCYNNDGRMGLIMLVMSCLLAKTDSTNFDGPGHKTLVANIFSNVGLIAKFVDPIAKEVTAFTDAICPLTATILTFSVEAPS